MATASLGGSARFRPWRDLRWLTGGVVAVGLGGLVWNLVGPEPPIRVSRETTYLTEPLDADGLPDYEAAVLAAGGPPPPPEENAAVFMLRACWPLGIESAQLPAVCKALGIPPDAPDASLTDPEKDAAAGISAEMLEVASRPWREADGRPLADWLRKQQPLIDLVVEAGTRPRYWLPSPTLLMADRQMLLSMLLPDVQYCRGACRVLAYRAMWHVGEGRRGEAWRDILAIRRLARLLVPPPPARPCLVTQLVAIAIEWVADDKTRWLLGSGDLPPALLAEIRRDLAALGPLLDGADGLAFERLAGVDAVVWIACREPRGRSGRIRSLASGPASTGVLGLAFFTSLDWNVVLERMNANYDAIEAAVRMPTHAERIAALDRQQDKAAASIRGPRGSVWAFAGDILLAVCNRSHRSERAGDVLVGLLAPALSHVHGSVVRSAAQSALTTTAVALAAWRADRNSGDPAYPERLDELVPRYLHTAPVDPFTGGPLVYERRGDGYLLASVGHNGVYDGGDDIFGRIVDGEWQDHDRTVDREASDLVVRMPMPQPRNPRAPEIR